MTAYFYIITSLLLYPIIGYLTMRLTKRLPVTRRVIICTLCFISGLVTLGLLTHIIIISQNLNWFLVTSIYLTTSVLIWMPQTSQNSILKGVGAVLRFAIFGFGYLIATFGSLFVLIALFDLETDQRKWVTDNLIYKERNIGQGPDPSVRLKKIVVYKRVELFPILAYRIKAKTYDEWNLPLKKTLDVSFSANNQTLLLTSTVNGYKVFNFADIISLTDKYYR